MQFRLLGLLERKLQDMRIAHVPWSTMSVTDLDVAHSGQGLNFPPEFYMLRGLESALEPPIIPRQIALHPLDKIDKSELIEGKRSVALGDK